MSPPWKRWKKPWTRQQCEQRYVQGDRIFLKDLAVESGVSERQLERWSAEGEKPWPKLRREFGGELAAATTKKAIEKISEKASDEFSNLTFEHLEAYRIYRQLATIYGNFLLEKANSNPLELSKLPAYAINFWSLALDRSIQGERKAAGLEYEDVNKAIQFLQSLGYEIVDPTQQNQADTEAQAED